MLHHTLPIQMKKILLIFSLVFLTNCAKEEITNECFNNINITGTIQLSNPEFIDLLVPSGYTTTRIAGRDILIINTTSSGYKAFDLQCPEGDCSSSMTFDGTFIKCSCDDKQYNYLQGGRPTDGEGCFALEYNVLEGNGTLQISAQ